jgi:hypothetical protein
METLARMQLRPIGRMSIFSCFSIILLGRAKSDIFLVPVFLGTNKKEFFNARCPLWRVF